MSVLKQLFSRLCISVSLILLSHNTFAAVSNCHPTNSQGTVSSLNIPLVADITSSTSGIAPGTQLATSLSGFLTLTCDFTGQNTDENRIYFKNITTAAIKNMLLENGVEIFQQQLVGGDGTIINLTDTIVPNLYVYVKNAPLNEPIHTASFAFRYSFTVKKGNNALKPFDTGLFLLGYHVNSQGMNIGAPIYLSMKGNLTLLCPSPSINITANNGGQVGFGAVSPQQMRSGGVISKIFNLSMGISPDCETGLNVSVRFESNGNTILADKYLDMGNGLQVLINNGSTDINYGETYPVGAILPFAPITVPYTATLSQIPSQSIITGPFSKTIRVVASY